MYACAARVGCAWRYADAKALDAEKRAWVHAMTSNNTLLLRVEPAHVKRRRPLTEFFGDESIVPGYQRIDDGEQDRSEVADQKISVLVGDRCFVRIGIRS